MRLKKKLSIRDTLKSRLRFIKFTTVKYIFLLFAESNKSFERDSMLKWMTCLSIDSSRIYKKEGKANL